MLGLSSTQQLEQVKASNPKDALGIRRVPISTVPQAVLAEVGIGMLEGACKYRRHNYREIGVRASVYIDALWRHIFLQWWDQGEDIDDPSGLSHITKGICSLIVLRDAMLQGKFYDDRPPRSPTTVNQFNEKTVAMVEKYPDAPEPYTHLGVQQVKAVA